MNPCNDSTTDSVLIILWICQRKRFWWNYRGSEWHKVRPLRRRWPSSSRVLDLESRSGIWI